MTSSDQFAGCDDCEYRNKNVYPHLCDKNQNPILKMYTASYPEWCPVQAGPEEAYRIACHQADTAIKEHDL